MVSLDHNELTNLSLIQDDCDATSDIFKNTHIYTPLSAILGQVTLAFRQVDMVNIFL